MCAPSRREETCFAQGHFPGVQPQACTQQALNEYYRNEPDRPPQAPSQAHGFEPLSGTCLRHAPPQGFEEWHGQTPASFKPPRPAPYWPSTHCMLLPLCLCLCCSFCQGCLSRPHTSPVVPRETGMTSTSHSISWAFSLEGLYKGQEWNQICILEATLGMNSS